jgi:two-component system sensor histidine kinase EvgS
LLRLILKGSTHELFYARNGEEAVSVVKDKPYIELIFMDLKMPVLDGFEATKRIKQIRPEMLVIAQTAYAYEEDRLKALEAGCDEFITKPITREGIHQLIGKYL